MGGGLSNAAGCRWYVVHTRPRQEIFVAGVLEMTPDVATYVPEVKQQRGTRVCTTPLFPGYLFVWADLGRTPASLIDTTPGVVRLVAFGERPQAVPDAVIESLRQQVTALDQQGGLPQHPFRPGDSVRFSDGPLRGLHGVFQGPTRPSQRVRILMRFLGDLHEVEADAGTLERAEATPSNRPARRTRGKGRPIGPR